MPNQTYGLDNNLKDRDGNEWTQMSGDVTLQLGDHVILSSMLSGRDRCQPAVVTEVPGLGGRRSSYKVSVNGKNAGCPPRLFAYYRRGNGSVPEDAVNLIPHLSKGKWVKGCPDRLRYGQAVKIQSRKRALKDKIGLFERMKITKASIQFGDDLWGVSPSNIAEYQEMS